MTMAAINITVRCFPIDHVVFKQPGKSGALTRVVVVRLVQSHWTEGLPEGSVKASDWLGLTRPAPEGECTLVPLH